MRTARLFSLLCVMLTVPYAWSQTYPSKPVQIIVPFSVGSTTDIMTRVIAQDLAKRLGQAVIVDNKPGAGGNIGAEFVARATPDGYTLMMGSNGPLAANVALYDRLSFDPTTDFAPIIQVVATPQFLLANPNVGVRSVQEMVALAKAHPGKFNIGATNTTARVWIELLKKMAGIDVVAIPYKDVGTMIGDLLSGQTQFAVENVGPTLSLIEGRRLQALALLYPQRAGFAPDVPSIAEAGYRQHDVVGWIALLAPRGTPPEIVRRLNSEVQAAMQSSDVSKVLMGYGIVTGGTPAQLGEKIKAETSQWKELVETTGVRLQ